MFNELFKFLNFLRPKTLAYLAQDLSDSQEEWQYYPENAPAETLQQELKQILEIIMAIGIQQAEAEGLDFAQLVEQATTEQQRDDWRWQRNQQVRQNWTSDLE